MNECLIDIVDWYRSSYKSRALCTRQNQVGPASDAIESEMHIVEHTLL